MSCENKGLNLRICVKTSIIMFLRSEKTFSIFLGSSRPHFNRKSLGIISRGSIPFSKKKDDLPSTLTRSSTYSFLCTTEVESVL